MGRRRRYAVDDGRIVSSAKIGEDHGKISPDRILDVIEDRLGHNDKVCQHCNLRVSESVDNCRRCGRDNFRRKKSSFTDE